MFWVRVPVLSEHITETDPRPSTARSCFIIAFSLAIFWVPIARTIVTIDPRASGIAATARATANIRESSKGISLYMLSPNTKAHIPSIINANFLLKSSKLTWRGVFFSDVDSRSVAIFPISVFIPIPVTTTNALP